MIGKDPQAAKPGGEVQREEATVNKDMWKEMEIPICPQCPLKPQAPAAWTSTTITNDTAVKVLRGGLNG